MERLKKDFVELVKKLPEGKTLSKHLGGSLSWSFFEDRGFGLKSLTLRKAREAGR